MEFGNEQLELFIMICSILNVHYMLRINTFLQTTTLYFNCMPIIATTKSRLIYSDLKQKILSGELRPDTRLVIRQLADSYCSSDIPVREALAELAAEDLIEMSPHKGSRVKKLSIKEMKDMLEVRKALEPLAASLAAENGTAALVDCLKQMLAQSKKFAQEKNYSAYSNANRAFHQLITDASDNIYLKKILGELLRNAQRTKTIFDVCPEIIEVSLQEHEQMISLIEQKKSSEMYELTLMHKARPYDILYNHFTSLINMS